MFGFIRAVLALILVVLLAGAAGVFLLGYRTADGSDRHDTVVGTSGHDDMATRAREQGVVVGEKLGAAADTVQDALSDGAITAKIKSKMALDDTIKARDIKVSTKDGVVTLTGHVASTTERDRAVQLAKETEGVKQVKDELQIREGGRQS